MRISVWMYPWGELAESPIAALQRLQGLGVSEVRVAVAYHPIVYPDPLTPGRTIEKPTDAVYIPWQGPAQTAPVVDALADRRPEWLSRLVESAHQVGIRVTAWLVLLRNETLQSRYPEMAIVSATGESLAGGLCLDRPATRAYALALVSACARAAVDQIVLESGGLAPFYGLAVPTGNDWMRFLRGLCFCDSCQALMAGGGLDAETVKARVMQGMDQPYQNLSDADAHHWLKGAKLDAVQTFRNQATGEFWSVMAGEAHRQGLELGVTGRWPDTLVEGYHPANLNQVDYFTHLWYSADLAADVEAFVQLKTAVTSRLEVGIRVPEHRPMVGEVRGALQQGAVETVVVYTLSRIPRNRWEWLTELRDN